MYHCKTETYLKNAFKETFSEEINPEKPRPEKLEETINICKNIFFLEKNRQEKMEEEKRTGFWQYLSDVFRFEGFLIFGLQTAALLFACLNISFLTKEAAAIPIFMPLFALAATPPLLRSQYHKVSEIEAATRASGAQIILAKLVLAGAANLICFTFLLWLCLSVKASTIQAKQLILYVIVPYLACMVLLLRGIRLQKCKNALSFLPQIFGFSLCYGIMPKALPELYKASAVGIWFIAFIAFVCFFIREILYIADMRKRGKMYGIIA